jgi:hypothetical protein
MGQIYCMVVTCLEVCIIQEQTGDSALVQSKGTKTKYMYSIRIIEFWFSGVN